MRDFYSLVKLFKKRMAAADEKDEARTPSCY